MGIFRFGSLNRTMAGIYNGITSSIAFYPVIITLFYLVLVIFLLWFDYSGIASEIVEEMPGLRFKEMDTVRAILTTLIAGIISLMALSFSMVMVVLNQATSTVSPKVMQGLVSRKEHQFVLGNQFGSVLYFMIVLLLLRGIDYYQIPNFSVAFGLLLGFWSLGLFVYFIHNISQSIQVTNIVSHTYNQTCRELINLREKTKEENLLVVPEADAFIDTPFTFKTDKPGFLQKINGSGLTELAEKYNLQIRIEPYLTQFVPGNTILFRTNVSPENLLEKCRQQIYNSLLFYNGEDITTNYVYGFTQLSEIAVKALSPGINDPGIAIICVNYLSDLFLQLYTVKEQNVFLDGQKIPRLQFHNISFGSLLNKVLTPIRHYSKQDLAVALALLELLGLLGQADQEEKRYQDIVNQHTEAILTEIGKNTLITADTESFNTIIEKMHQTSPGYFQVRKFAL